MAAAGTGLPTPSRRDVATTLTDTGSYGVGEQLAAQALTKVAANFDQIEQGLQPFANKRAADQAAQDAAAGIFTQRLAITPDAAAYNVAMRHGTMARLQNAADRDLDEIKAAHPFDPDGYSAAVRQYRAAALNPDGGAVPGPMAIDWSADFDQRANQHLSVIRNARAAADLDEAKGSLLARIDRLVADSANVTPGGGLNEMLGGAAAQSNLLQLRRAYDALADNPAFGVSREEADALFRAKTGEMKAGVASQYALGVLRDQGADAALAAVQGLGTDEALGDVQTRQLVQNTAAHAVQQELSLTNQRTAQAQAEISRNQQEVGRLIDEDVAHTELTGNGTGLTAEQVRALGGETAVSSWYKRRADALQFNERVGALPLNDPESAARMIAERTTASGNTDAGFTAVQDDQDLDTLIDAMSQVETPGRPDLISRDPDGAGGGRGGAVGDMQILPETAQRIAREIGVAYDPNRLLHDVAYNRAIGRRYLSELITRYNGDSFLAVAAYHAGERNVDGWLRSVGDPRNGSITREAWLAGVESRGNPLSAAYPRKVLAAMQAGRANAEWDAYAGRRGAQREDPARSVLTDFTVKSARDAWMADPHNSGAAQTYVTANLQAQERQGIPSGIRRTLPNSVLATYAGDLLRIERTGDGVAYQAYLRSLAQPFGRYGQQVMQDVLEVKGDSRLAAMVTARANSQAATGRRPAPAHVDQANAAARTNQMTRAATGTSDVSHMTDEQLRAAAGL